MGLQPPLRKQKTETLPTVGLQIMPILPPPAPRMRDPMRSGLVVAPTGVIVSLKESKMFHQVVLIEKGVFFWGTFVFFVNPSWVGIWCTHAFSAHWLKGGRVIDGL